MRGSPVMFRVLSVAALLVAATARAWAAVPMTPTIIEPATAGQVLHFADVHMATLPFADADPGDAHSCSDWEISTVDPPEIVWAAPCVTEPSVRVHAHFGDGTFQGARAGLHELAPDTDHVVRVRHRDLANSPSLFAERPFRTSPATVIAPLELDDVRTLPAPEWTDGAGGTIAPGDGALRVESPLGELLLGLVGSTVMAPPPLDRHVPLRVMLEGPLVVPVSQLVFTGGDGAARTIHLPAVVLAGGEERFFWVSINGSSFDAQPNAVLPDFSSLAQGAAVPWSAPPGYVVEVVASGFQLPVNIAFVPQPGPEADAPLYYVSELYGSIKVVGRDGSVRDYATDLLNFDPLAQIPGSGELGVTGIVVDPANGDVLASLLVFENNFHHPRVIRLHSIDGGRTAGMPTIVLDMPQEAQSASHQISQLTFGPDGMLYVHMGDGFFTHLARDLTWLRGKILRITPQGAPAPGNPYYDPTDGITARDFIYASGFRNPFGGAWRDVDGHLYEVENGPSVDRFARIVAGADYGWDGSDQSMTIGALYNWSPPPAPVSLAWIQESTFGGSGFPDTAMGLAFVTLSGPTWASGVIGYAKRIVSFALDPDGVLVSGPSPFVVYTGVGKATAAGMAAGPDGLYFTDLYKDVDYRSPIDRGAHILRVRFTGSADFTADVRNGPPPLTVQFTDVSSVPEATTWLWNFGDGTTSTEPHPSHTYIAPGRYTVRLSVTGPAGVSVLRREAYVRVGTTVTDLLASASPSRSEAVLLDGSTVAGNVHAFVDPPAGVSTVAFSVDGVPVRTESVAPFDLGGTAADGSAMPFATAGLAEGVHTASALVSFLAGGSETVTAQFVVDNEPCGSGVTSAGEECDDGNTADGDCCSSTCQRDDDGTVCSDGVDCTVGDTCHAGVCAGSHIDCSGLDQECSVGACDGEGCVAVPRDDGTACDDEDPCTTNDGCTAGICQGTANTCDDGVACTADTCDGGTCTHTGIAGCCTGDADCDDGDACTGVERCTAGTCVAGTALVCDDGVGCTTDACDPAAGCTHTPAGCCAASCDDGDVCNGAEACDASDGSCRGGTPLDCDDGDACTVDRCDGGCVQTPLDLATVTAGFQEPLVSGCPPAPRGVRQALRRARRRLERAATAAELRRTRLIERAVADVERAQRIAVRRNSPMSCVEAIAALGRPIACVR